MTGALEAGAGFLQHPGVEYWRRTNPVTHTYLPLDNSFNRIFKRVMDVLFSLFVIIFVLSWFIPLAAIIIKTGSAGPVFFRQKRIKRNGKVFTCIKFRTMLVNEEADWLPAAKNDRRITHTGKFFREYFLDELPQFFNVLTGDMSIVGPRPHMLEDEKKFQSIADHYTLRNKVKPGIRLPVPDR